MKTLDWIRANVHPEGGLRAWPGQKAYPEVTGYIIPTLLKYGEDELAREFAEWLIKTQEPDGAWRGLDGQKRTFDTAACYEGIRSVYIKFYRLVSVLHTGKARRWLMKHQTNGAFWVSERDANSHIYTLRVNGILGFDVPPPKALVPNRLHYIAYALEGLLMLGYQEYVFLNLNKIITTKTSDNLLPFSIDENWIGSDSDTCATAQIAVLMMEMGMDASDLMEGLANMVAPSGGLMLKKGNKQEVSWAAKYYLDAYELFTRHQ